MSVYLSNEWRVTARLIHLSGVDALQNNGSSGGVSWV